MTEYREMTEKEFCEWEWINVTSMHDMTSGRECVVVAGEARNPPLPISGDPDAPHLIPDFYKRRRPMFILMV